MLTYWIWLATRQNLSRSKQLSLLEYFSTPDAIYSCGRYPQELGLSENALSSLENKDLTASKRLIKLCSDRKVRIITLQDTIYPARLRQIPDMPIVLYCKPCPCTTLAAAPARC